MKRVGTIAELRRVVAEARQSGKTIAFVPTMGYLHEGHLKLVETACDDKTWVVMSIFVNPLQFGPNEDFTRYPRDLERDVQLAEEAGVDLLFHPSVEEMYPMPSQFQVEVGRLSQVLCGASRPGHFSGVATVITKFFNLVQPDRAYFGKKDYQQYLIIQRLVQEFNFPVEIVGVPIVREPDGLAKSSRNTFLSPEERQEAVVLYQSLQDAQTLIKAGERNPTVVVEQIKARIAETRGVIDYVEVRGAGDLTETDLIQGPVLIALAVRFGTTRLIDNLVTEG